MNKENLQKMADYIRTIPQEKFDMGRYRFSDNLSTHECNSVGCVVGHCTILDDQENIPRDLDNNICFGAWSAEFTGLRDRPSWKWCFSGIWCKTDNTLEGAALRIEWLIKNGLPFDWREQMYGGATLCYK